MIVISRVEEYKQKEQQIAEKEQQYTLLLVVTRKLCLMSSESIKRKGAGMFESK